jgi:hypothetical protein
MSTATVKAKAWYVNRCKDGCQFCCVKFPGRVNNGLVLAHIIEDGPNTQNNFLALCPNCEKSFDNMMKPAIYEALTTITDGTVPETWKGKKA